MDSDDTTHPLAAIISGDKAVDVYRLLNGMPDGMDGVIIGNFKLAGFP